MYGTGTGNLTVLARTLSGANISIISLNGQQGRDVWNKATVCTYKISSIIIL